MSKRSLVFLVALGLLLFPTFALADSISPDTVTVFGDPTKVVTKVVHKTVTIPAGTPTTAQADIFFLSDTTGSMGGTINTVKTNAAAIMTATAGLGNVQWAVGEYKDVGDPFVYRLNQAMTANQASVQTGINQWAASGGGDTPEANLFGIQQATTAASGWRVGSQQIMVQFGDAPGHDPSGPTGVTLAQATAALVGPPNTKLIAVDVGAKNSTGQETVMVNATGGTYLNNPSPADLTNAVINAITTSFSTYHTVALDLSEVPGTVGVAVIPTEITGDFTRETERTFEFDVVFAVCCLALEGKNVDFNIYATVDGARVATETDHIICSATPLPSTMLFLGTGLVGLLGLRKRF